MAGKESLRKGKVSPLRMEDISRTVVEQGITEQKQTMTSEKVFWSHFSPNLVPAGWVLGILLVVSGLDFRTGLFAIVLGNILGSLPVALCALIGPQTGLTQIESSRFAFGKMGKRVPAFLNWVCCVGWDAVNNVPSTLALIALFALAGIRLEFWFVLAFLVAIQMVIGIYGHHLVQAVEKYLGYFLLVVFAITGILALVHGGVVTTATKPISLSAIVLRTAIVCSYNLGWAAYSADYTRYLPKHTPKKTIFWLAFLGLVLSAGAMEFLGLMIASQVADPTPTAVIGNIQKLTGAFAPLALLAIGISSIANNALNDNTAAYNLISAGIRLSRPASAIVTAALSFVIAVYGSGQFASLYENYLLVLLYWVAPWVAIVLTHWYLNGQVAPRSYPQGWTGAATIFVVVTVLTIALFASTSVYTGPIAKLLDGTDIGYFVGFIVAAALYATIARPLSKAKK